MRSFVHHLPFIVHRFFFPVYYFYPLTSFSNIPCSIPQILASNGQTTQTYVRFLKKVIDLENEIELIKGCRAGKDSARKELYTLYSKQMLAVCFRYTGDMDAAHDVLHDGFIKIFTNFSFRGESSLCTWITRVMVTQSLDFLRREKRVSQLVVHEEQLPDIPDISDSGGGAGISEEQLMAFIAELPDGCRTVFNLYVFEEKSHKEIAKMLHIKEHSSTSQLHRAKYLLAKRIKEYRNHEERK